MSPLCEKLCLPLQFQQQQRKQCFTFVPNPIIVSFILFCVNALAFSALPQHKLTLIPQAPVLLQALHQQFCTLTFLMRKAQCDDAIEMQQSDARNSGCLECRFSCSGVQCSRKAKHRHCLGAAPLGTLDVDVGEWSIPHTRKGVFFSSFFPYLTERIQLRLETLLSTAISESLCLSTQAKEVYRSLWKKFMKIAKNSAFVTDSSQTKKLIFMHPWGEVSFPLSLSSTLANPWRVPLNSSLKFPVTAWNQHFSVWPLWVTVVLGFGPLSCKFRETSAHC